MFEINHEPVNFIPLSPHSFFFGLAKRLKELFEPHKFLPHLLHYYLEIAEEEAGDDEAGLYGGEGAVFQGVAGGYLHGFQFMYPS